MDIQLAGSVLSFSCVSYDDPGKMKRTWYGVTVYIAMHYRINKYQTLDSSVKNEDNMWVELFSSLGFY